MKPGELHTVELTTEQLGYVSMCVRQILRKDLKGARRFGDDLDPGSSLAHRLRVGYDVSDVIAEVKGVADAGG